MNRQIFLRVLPDSFDQVLCVGKQLVGVVIHRGIVQKLPRRALTGVQLVTDV